MHKFLGKADTLPKSVLSLSLSLSSESIAKENWQNHSPSGASTVCFERSMPLTRGKLNQL